MGRVAEAQRHHTLRGLPRPPYCTRIPRSPATVRTAERAQTWRRGGATWPGLVTRGSALGSKPPCGDRGQPTPDGVGVKVGGTSVAVGAGGVAVAVGTAVAVAAAVAVGWATGPAPAPVGLGVARFPVTGVGVTSAGDATRVGRAVPTGSARCVVCGVGAWSPGVEVAAAGERCSRSSNPSAIAPRAATAPSITQRHTAGEPVGGAGCSGGAGVAAGHPGSNPMP
jgi:hypothetical protein